MKRPVLHLFLFVLLGFFIAFLSSIPASSPPGDSLHICAFDNYELLRRDHPRPAAKRPANLNVGEPRTVRMIYFLPNDWPYRAEVVDSMKTVIVQSQTFYREQMQAHGYGDRTFGIETDASGEPLVHRVDGQHPFSHYDNTLGTAVVAELEQTFDLDANIYFIVLGTNALRQGNGQPAGGVGRRRTKNGGAMVVPDRFSFFTVAHELGHTFGLYHDFRDNRYIMSYGHDQRGVLSACAAEFLAAHAYFNPAVPIEEGQPPTVDITSPTRYQPGTTSVPVRIRVSDPEVLHQVILIGNAKPCRGLAGKREAVVEFNYDGSYSERGFSTLSNRSRHNLLIVAVDRAGNVSETYSFLTEISPYEIAVLRGDTDHVHSVAFSPEGTMLAAGVSSERGQSDTSILLWDVQTRGVIANLKGHTTGQPMVTFSPDGALLASGGWWRHDRTVRVWDLATRREIASLDGAAPVAFSPDGSRLAYVSREEEIKIWDVGRRRETGTMVHADKINALAFSPDGSLIAAGTGRWWESGEGAVRLWHVARQAEITIIEAPSSTAVEAVAFSPDGTMLAYGWWTDGAVKLWDVARRQQIDTLEGAGPVVFSPDGTILAAQANDRSIKLWDAASRQELIALSGVEDANSVSYSPGGAMLASGSFFDGTITLWDVSEWKRPRPFALEIVSGDGQQGASGNALAHPLVVEVRDQYGNVLPGARVTFTIIEGEGRLSNRFTVEHATTDATGRAELSLTLGPNPGPNAVVVSIGERELATFIADGVGTAVAELDGDYRTWHLPTSATVRLGKGAIGGSDRAVALSPDGILAVASGIGVWLHEAAKALALMPTDSPVHSVAFSPNRTLAAGLDNGMVQLWDVEAGTTIGSLNHGGWGGLAVIFSSDGTRLASRWRQEIKLWDVETTTLTGTWEVPTDVHWHGAGESVAFSPDGSRLASGFQDGTVRLWDVETRKEVVTLEGHTHWVISVSFSPDGALLASGGGREDPNVRLWDVSTQKEVAKLRGHEKEVRSVSFSPDGATLASGSLDGTVLLWDVEKHEEVATQEDHQEGIVTVSFSPDGATLVSGVADGTLLIRDVETGNLIRLSGYETFSSVALSTDGTLIASGSEEGKVRLWDAATRTPIATLEGHTSEVGSVSFSADGGVLASGSWDRTIKLWDVGTRELVGTLEGHIGGVTSVSFSPDGATVASAGGWRDGTVRLWDVATREVTGILEGHTSEVRSVSFSSDGVLLASAGGYDDKTVRLWNARTGELIGILEGHTGSVDALAFSPDDALLSSGSRDGVTLWDVGTRQRRATLDNRRPVYSLAFSAVGTKLAAGTWNGATLWDVETRKQIASLDGHSREVHSVAFSPDGRTLISGSDDGTMLLWDIARYLAPSIPNPDFDGDGTVGFPDFLQFAAQFGSSQGDAGYDARFDLDGNGTIGFSDLLILAESYGKSSN